MPCGLIGSNGLLTALVLGWAVQQAALPLSTLPSCASEKAILLSHWTSPPQARGLLAVSNLEQLTWQVARPPWLGLRPQSPSSCAPSGLAAAAPAAPPAFCPSCQAAHAEQLPGLAPALWPCFRQTETAAAAAPDPFCSKHGTLYQQVAPTKATAADLFRSMKSFVLDQTAADKAWPMMYGCSTLSAW